MATPNPSDFTALDPADFKPVGVASSQNPDDFKPVRSALGEIATGAKSGLYQGIAGAGAVLQAPAEIARMQPGIVSRVGKAVEDYGKSKLAGEDLALQPGAHNALTNFAASQVAPAPGGMLPMLASSAAGAVAGGAAAGPPGAIVGSGLGAGSETYLQTYHEKYQEALAKRPDDIPAARDYASKSAALQGGIMAGLGMVPGAGPLALGARKTAAEAAQATIAKHFLPEAGKSVAQLTAANVAGGAAGAAGQASIDQGAGLGTGATPEEAAKGSVGSSLGATLGFLPLALLHARGNVLAAAKTGRALADPTMDAKDRQAAADTVAANIGKYDKVGAQNWAANAAQGIREGKPIGVGPDWMTGPHPDLFADVTGAPATQLAGPPPSQSAPGGVNFATPEEMAAAAAVPGQRQAEQVRRGGLPPDVQKQVWGEVLDKDGNPVAEAQAPAQAAAPPAPPDPLHAPDAGPLARVAGAAVDAGIAADPYKAPVEEAHPIRAEVTQPPDLQMQNRDRSRPGSIAQMNAIAQHPDYDRLGPGKSPNEAAPMVSVGANHPTIPEEDYGKSSLVVLGDNSKIASRYAVVEAPDVLASHNVDGSVNGDYFAQIPPGTIRALNNGRVAALQEAYKRGTADDYKAAMIADAATTGIDPAAIEAKKNPILVRVYDDKENERPNIGALSNPQSALKASAPEQAHNDARLLDAGALHVDDDGNIMGAKNDAALKQFLQALPASEHNDLVGKAGFTKAFNDRVKGALFAKAYGNLDLVNMAMEEREPDIKNILGALTQAAPEFAQVEHGGALDIRPSIIEAAHIIREAKARGIKPADMVAHPDMLGRDPMTQTLAAFMVENARSAPRMAEAFKSMARFLKHEREASTTVDIFNKGPATMADLARSVNTHLENEYGPETKLRVAEKGAAYADQAKERAAASGSGTRAAPAAHVRERAEQQKPAAEKAKPAEVAPFTYEPSKTLAPEHSAIETRFGKDLAAHPEKLSERYAALKDSKGGRVLNTDTARELSADYLKNRALAAAVHEPASALMKRLFTERLAEAPKPGQRPLVLFTAGGTGAGKSTAIESVPLVQNLSDQAQIIYDTNMNTLASARQKVQQALDAGKDVTIAYVYRDPVESLVGGALTRAERQANDPKIGSGRTVPIDEHQKTHVGSAEVVRQLQVIYKDDPRVTFEAIDNTRGAGNAVSTTLDKLPAKFDNVDLRKKLNEALETEHDAGRISDATYRGFKGAETEQPRSRGVLAEARAKPGGEPERQRPKEEAPGHVAEPSSQSTPATERAMARALREQDIPPLYFTKTRVPLEVYIADEGKTETIHVPAKQALAEVREEISRYQKLLDCVSGAAA